jgi:hypothetical protein
MHRIRFYTTPLGRHGSFPQQVAGGRKHVAQRSLSQSTRSHRRRRVLHRRAPTSVEKRPGRCWSCSGLAVRPLLTREVAADAKRMGLAESASPRDWEDSSGAVEGLRWRFLRSIPQSQIRGEAPRRPPTLGRSILILRGGSERTPLDPAAAVDPRAAVDRGPHARRDRRARYGPRAPALDAGAPVAAGAAISGRAPFTKTPEGRSGDRCGDGCGEREPGQASAPMLCRARLFAKPRLRRRGGAGPGLDRLSARCRSRAAGGRSPRRSRRARRPRLGRGQRPRRVRLRRPRRADRPRRRWRAEPLDDVLHVCPCVSVRRAAGVASCGIDEGSAGRRFPLSGTGACAPVSYPDPRAAAEPARTRCDAV